MSNPNINYPVLDARYNSCSVTNVKDYGAKGDGTTDDSGAIQAAITAAQTAGGGIVQIPAGNYVVASAISITASGISIRGASAGGTKIIIGYTGAQFTGTPVFSFRGTVPAQSAPTIALSADGTISTNTAASFTAAQTVSVASSSAVNVGDVVLIGDNYTQSWLSSGWNTRYRGEFVQVQSKTSTSVTFTTPLRDVYTVARSAAIYKPTLLTGCSISDIAFTDPANTTPGTFSNYVGGVRFYGATQAKATGISATNLGYSVVDMTQVYIGEIANCSALNSYMVAYVGSAEAIQISNCFDDGSINGFSLANADAGQVGWTRNAVVTGSTTTRNSLSGFDTHPWGSDISFVGCRAERMSAPAYQNRSIRTQFISCVAENISGPIVDIGQGQAIDTKLISCTFKDGTSMGVNIYGNATEGYPSDVTIQDCIFQNLGAQAIDIATVTPNFRIINNTFINPWASDVSNSCAIYIHNSAAITDAYIIGNTVSGARSIIWSLSASESSFIIASNKLVDPVGAPIMLRGLAASNVVTDNHQTNGTGAISQFTTPISSTTSIQAQNFTPTGLTGAAAASRYVGATTSGAPTSGTFSVGDFIVDQSGSFWVCTTAGTPGTWTQSGSGSSVPATDIQIFTANGTWTKPTGAKACTITLIGPGGGGASGGRGASGAVVLGGGGGGGGGRVSQTVPAALLNATVSLVIGAGGTGGASQTTDSTAGIAGNAGSASTSFAGYFTATRGGGGSSGGAGYAGTGDFSGTGGAIGSATGGAGNTPGTATGAPGGAGGGGITTAGAASNGGSGVSPTGATGITPGAAGVAGGSINGGNGNASLTYGGGASGGGGASSVTGVGGTGGNGGNYGAAGGGGGASLNGSASGAGGNGAPGLGVVITYF